MRVAVADYDDYSHDIRVWMKAPCSTGLTVKRSDVISNFAHELGHHDYFMKHKREKYNPVVEEPYADRYARRLLKEVQ